MSSARTIFKISVVIVLIAAPLFAKGKKTTPAMRHLEDEALGGKESIYTGALQQLLRAWPPKQIDYRIFSPNPLRLKCFATEGNEYYIGIEQVMHVESALEEVDKIVANIDDYKNLFPGFKQIKIESREGDKLLTFWEQDAPFFLAPNIKYKMLYLIDRTRPKRVVYRYQLKESDTLLFSDGIIVLEAEGADKTRYTEYDFYDAKWGAAKTFAPGRIWKDSVEGLYLSDMAFKLKAENPGWTDEQVRKEAENWLKKFPVEPVIKNKVPFYIVNSKPK